MNDSEWKFGNGTAGQTSARAKTSLRTTCAHRPPIFLGLLTFNAVVYSEWYLRRPDVPDESLLRWCLPYLWDRRSEVSRVRPGGPGWSDDLRLPQDDQVHLLQIWSQWWGGETRCRLHFAAERRQREDLRLPLVLVPFSWYPQFTDRHI